MKNCIICNIEFNPKRIDSKYCSVLCKRKSMYLKECGGELKGRGKNLLGMKFTKLTVVGKSKVQEKGSITWDCICDCGNKTSAKTAILNFGYKKSCGCLHGESARSKETKKRKHGMWNTPTYKTWVMMKSRCYDTNNESYYNYGAVGITVCDSWKNSFEEFLSDMGVRPKGMTIDRIDNSKGYFKENCRWQTAKQQANNRRTNVFIIHEGKKISVEDYSKILNITDSGVRFRLKRDFKRVGNTFIKESDPAYASVIKSIEENCRA